MDSISELRSEVKLLGYFFTFSISIFSNFYLPWFQQPDIDISPSNSCSQVSLLLTSTTPRERHPSRASNLSNTSDQGSYQGPRVSPYSGLAPDTVSSVCRPGVSDVSSVCRPGVSGQYCSVSVDNVASADSGGGGGQVILHNISDKHDFFLFFSFP